MDMILKWEDFDNYSKTKNEFCTVAVVKDKTGAWIARCSLKDSRTEFLLPDGLRQNKTRSDAKKVVEDCLKEKEKLRLTFKKGRDTVTVGPHVVKDNRPSYYPKTAEEIIAVLNDQNEQAERFLHADDVKNELTELYGDMSVPAICHELITAARAFKESVSNPADLKKIKRTIKLLSMYAADLGSYSEIKWPYEDALKLFVGGMIQEVEIRTKTRNDPYKIYEILLHLVTE